MIELTNKTRIIVSIVLSVITLIIFVYYGVSFIESFLTSLVIFVAVWIYIHPRVQKKLKEKREENQRRKESRRMIREEYEARAFGEEIGRHNAQIYIDRTNFAQSGFLSGRTGLENGVFENALYGHSKRKK